MSGVPGSREMSAQSALTLHTPPESVRPLYADLQKHHDAARLLSWLYEQPADAVHELVDELVSEPLLLPDEELRGVQLRVVQTGQSIESDAIVKADRPVNGKPTGQRKASRVKGEPVEAYG